MNFLAVFVDRHTSCNCFNLDVVIRERNLVATHDIANMETVPLGFSDSSLKGIRLDLLGTKSAENSLAQSRRQSNMGKVCERMRTTR